MEAQVQTLGWVPADTFASRLRLVRHELRLSVDEISAACGIPSATWSTWENGRKPHNMDERVNQIAAVTGVDRDWLMWGAQARGRPLTPRPEAVPQTLGRPRTQGRSQRGCPDENHSLRELADAA